MQGDCAPHLSGVKVKFPPWATLTVMFLAKTQAARLKKTGTMVAKRISQRKKGRIVGSEPGGRQTWTDIRSLHTTHAGCRMGSRCGGGHKGDRKA